MLDLADLRRRLVLMRGRHLRRRALAGAALGTAALLGPAVLAAPASAAGDTLSLAQSGPAAVGGAINLVASGQQPDVNEWAGGFVLDVFQKDPAVDPTCGSSFEAERSTYANEISTERFVSIGVWQGTGTSFSLPVKGFATKSGPALFCAYSVWVSDTVAAAAPLTVTVPPSVGPTPAPRPTPTPSPAALARPANRDKPRLTRSGHKLACSPGRWSGSPRRYGYAWLVNGHPKKGARGRSVRLGRVSKGAKVRCRVTASNAAGTSAPALSSAYRVR